MYKLNIAISLTASTIIDGKFMKFVSKNKKILKITIFKTLFVLFCHFLLQNV